MGPQLFDSAFSDYTALNNHRFRHKPEYKTSGGLDADKFDGFAVTAEASELNEDKNVEDSFEN